MTFKTHILTLTLLIASSSIFAQNKTPIDQIVATVGKNIVLKSDVEGQYYQLLAQGEIPSTKLKCKILEDQILEKLMLEKAASDSIVISEAQINSEIDRRLRYFIQQLGSEQKLEEYYQKSIPEIKSDFKEVIGEQLLVQKMQQEITGGLTVSPAEVKHFYNNFNEDSLPLIPEEVEINHILIQPKVTAAQKNATKQKLIDYKKRIQEGEDFQTLALLYSEDPGSAANGGELGFLGRGVLVPAFEQVAFSLAKDELSDIVETQFGYHLIQGIERRGEQVNVRHILLKSKVSSEALEAAQAKADSVYYLIKSDSLTYANAVKMFSDDEETKNSGGTIVNPQSASTKFPLAQLDASLSLAIDNLDVNQVSKPFAHTGNDGTAVFKIVQLKTRKKAHKANLVDDYSRIQQVTLANKKNTELQKWATEAKTESYIDIKPEVFGCEISDFWKVSNN